MVLNLGAYLVKLSKREMERPRTQERERERGSLKPGNLIYSEIALLIYTKMRHVRREFVRQRPLV